MTTHPRTALRLGLACTFVILSPAAIFRAAPPQINGTTPLGLQRGVSTELTVSGSAIAGNPRIIAPFAFKLDAPAPGGSDPSSWKIRLVVGPATAVGIYPVRIQTDEGLSNLFLLAVGQLPQVAEKEDNSTFDTAQVFNAPAVIEGQSAGNDVDYFRFHGKKGQRIVVDAQCARIGSGVDPSIRLTTADRTFIASADDTQGLITDARLFAVLPKDDDYVIELSDTRYQGGSRPVYRLVVGELPVAEEIYPLGGRRGETVGLELRGGTLDGLNLTAAALNPRMGATLDYVGARSDRSGTTAAFFDTESIPGLIVGDSPELRESSDPSAPPVRGAVPVVLNGRIDPAGDEDRFVLAVTPGQKLRIQVQAAEIGSALDGVLQVLNASGGVAATADDTTTPARTKQANAQPTISADPSLDYTVPAGVSEVTLALRDLETRGGVGFPYRISVSAVTPGYDVALNDAQVAIPKGGAAAVAVTVVRKGYSGPITLKVINPPPGLTVRPGMIAEGQLLGSFTVSAATDAAFPPTALEVVGEAPGPAGPIVARATKTIVFAQQANFPTNSLTQVGLPAAPAVGAPVELEAASEPFEVAHGFGATVKVSAKRSKDADGALAITPLPLPPGLAVPAAKFDEKATESSVQVTTTTDLPLGLVSVVLIAKGKIAGADRTLAVPTVTLNVVRPALIELASAALELKAGANVELKGKVVRKGAFKEPVTVKVNGLPAGVKAEPVTVASDASTFTLKLVAEEKAAAATAVANVALAFQVNKKDYPAQTTPLALKVLPSK